MTQNIADVAETLNAASAEDTGNAVAEVLGDLLSEQIGKRVNLRKVTKRDASILMLAFGADELAVRNYANKVARRMRSNALSHGSWSSII